MRTLKKVLALSLVFAMAFTLMAGAAYKDEDSIDSSLRDDITLMEALGVFQGDENGNFNPTNNVTRAEAAKMIYVLKNNGVDDGATAFQGVSNYSDVTTGFWAEGYINYCTNLGYMSGWSENGVQKFDPNGNVTGVELAKMLLCMIGYRADIQGYTNNNAWQTNVQQDAAEAGILTNFTPSLYAPVARQWTARLLVNAINATYVTYTKGELVFGTNTAGAEVSYASRYLRLETVEGYLGDAGKVSLNVKNTSSALDDDGDTIAIYKDKDLNTDRIDTFKTTVDPSLLGQHVKVYFRTGGTTTEEKVYAVIPTDESVVYNVTLGDVTAKQTADGETIKFEGYNNGNAKTYDDGSVITLIKNLDTVSNLTAKKTGTTAEFGVLAADSNTPVRFVDQDDDGKIDLAFVEETTYAIVDSHDASRYTIRFKDADGTSLKPVNDVIVRDEDDYNKINFVDTVAADDVVGITLDCTSGEKVWNVALVDSISNTISGYSLDGSNYASVTLNGESYDVADTNHNVAEYDIRTDGSIGSDNVFYTDGKYIIYSEGGESGTSVNNLMLITATAKTEDRWGDITYTVKGILTDGTEGSWTVSSVYDNANKKLDLETREGQSAAETLLGYTQRGAYSGQVMSYSLSGDNITLKALRDSSTTKFENGTFAFDESAGRVTVSNGTAKGVYRVNDSTYFFVKSKANTSDPQYSVVKASEATKDLETSGTTARAFAYKSESGVETILFAVIETNSSVKSAAADYAFMASKAVANYDGEVYEVTATVILPDGTETEIKKEFEDSTSANAAVSDWSALRGMVVKYELDVDGYVDEEVVAVDRAAASNFMVADKWYQASIIGWGNGAAVVALNADDSVTLDVASDVKMHYVDTTTNSYAVVTDSTDSMTTIQFPENADGDKITDGSVVNALIYVQDVDDVLTITDIFVQEDGSSIAKVWPQA